MIDTRKDFEKLEKVMRQMSMNDRIVATICLFQLMLKSEGFREWKEETYGECG